MVEKIIKNWSMAQMSGAWLPCPRCGLLRMTEVHNKNPVSRRADIRICDTCSVEEELEDSPIVYKSDKEFEQMPLEAWFVTRNVFCQSGVVRKGKGFEVVAAHPIFLTGQDIDDIVGCAMEGGCTYWCTDAELVGDLLGNCASDQISRGGALKLYDYYEDKWHELTLEKFMNGFKLWVEQGKDFYGAVSTDGVDCCHIDGDCADNIIQYALFGDLVYG